MTSATSLRKFLVPYALAALTGIGFGCVITTGGNVCDSSECGCTFSHSENVGDINGDGEDDCKCDPGHQWVNPGDPNDFECELIPSKSGCDCTDPHTTVSGNNCTLEDGYKWCSTNSNDCSACPDDDQVGGGTGQVDGDDGSGDDGSDGVDTGADDGADSTGGGPVCEQTDAEWNGVEPNPDDCTMDGLAFCSNVQSEGSAGARYWECSQGAWVETDLDEICQFENADFAYGCFDDGTQVVFDCGLGAGTPCSGPECDGCSDSDTHNFCRDNKLGTESCTEQCTVVGDDSGVTYDSGQCVDDADGLGCCCFDEGSEDCVLL